MKYLNYILQFLFIRIVQGSETNIKYAVPISFDPICGSMALKAIECEKYKWHSIQYFVFPLTGWFSDFKYIGNVRFFRITKKKLIL